MIGEPVMPPRHATSSKRRARAGVRRAFRRAAHRTHEAFKIPSRCDRKAAASLRGLNAVGVRYALRREKEVARAQSVLLVFDPHAKLPLQNV